MSESPAVERREDLDSVRSLLEEVAAACQRVLAESVSDPTATREVARSLGLSTTNAWRLVRLANDGPTVKVLQSMPGPRAWETVLSALDRTSAAPNAVAPLRNAVAKLHEELDRRGLSRSDLPRFAPSGTEAARQAVDAIDRSREMRTNALLWGASASAMATSYLVRVDAETGRPLVIGVSTFAGLRRIRPGPEWWLPSPDRVLFADRRAVPVAPDPRADLEIPQLLSDHARSELGVSPEGHIAFRGEHAKAAGAVDLAVAAGGLVEADDQGRLLERLAIFASPIWIPTTEFMLEVLFERGADPARAPQASIYAQVGSASVADVDRHHFLMPGSGSSEGLTKDERCEDLAPPFDDHSKAGRALHAAAIGRAIASMGLEPGDFVRHRLVVPNPVLCTMVELGWPTD